ncbi:MAG: TolC family protein [Bacteroidetes bacterium]|nr:MAG: TolC family protein [Bacteroidota bacterium]
MKYAVLILFTLTLTNAQAQRLTLENAIDIALKNSLDIQLSKNNVTIAQLNNSVGMAGGLPVIGATAVDNYSFIGVNQKLNTGEVIKRTGANANNVNANLTAGILLYNGNRARSTKRRLDELELRSKDELNSEVQNIMAAAMTAYFDIVRQQGYIKTIDVAIEVAKKKLNIVKTQQSVGLANNADLFQSQVDLNNLEQSRVSQQLIVDQAKAELLRLLTLNADSTINVEDTIQVDRTLALEATLNRLTANADILAADKQVRINQLIIKETAAQRYPTVKASTGYSYTQNNALAGQLLLNKSYGPVVGLSLNIPIYNGNVYKRQQKIAEVNAEIASVQKDILMRDYSANVVKTYKAYSATLQQLDNQQKNYDLAKELLDLVLQRFQLRQATIIDLSQAQQSFVTAGFTLINYSFVAKSAEIELKRVSNLLAL